MRTWFSKHAPEAILGLMLAGLLAAGSGSMSCSESKFNGRPAAPDFASLPLTFEWNSGQSDRRYGVLAQGYGYILYLSATELALDLRDRTSAPTEVVRMRLAGANSGARFEGVVPLPGRVNYFYGNDPVRWVTNVPTFARVRFRDVYPGIDVDYYGKQNQLEHDFIVAPGAEPGRIQLDFGDSVRVEVDSEGAILVHAGSEEMRWETPILYQQFDNERRRVSGGYRVENGRVGFQVGEYDKSRPLVIDPVVDYSTYMGRGGNEAIFGMVLDSAGNTYVAGTTTSLEYPITPGAQQGVPGGAGQGNVFVTKINAAGTAIVFSTHLGSSGQDVGTGVAVDATGNIYLTGTAIWDDFPTTTGAVQRRYGGRGQGTHSFGDCFITRLNSTGSALSYSTYLGGTSSDACQAIAVDNTGNAYVTGLSASANFPTSESAFQRSFRGGQGQPNLAPVDAFVTKLSPQGEVAYSTFVGGAGDESGTSIAVDSGGNAFVAGFTTSSTFPTTQGAFQRTYRGAGGQENVIFGDAFVLKVNPSGSALVYSTYLGGRQDDVAYAISIDSAGNAYVAGGALSSDFPVAGTPFQRSYAGNGGGTVLSSGDAFVAKLNSAGAALVYSTFLGGSMDDLATGIAVDPVGSAWITGHTLSRNFPVSTDATNRTYRGEGTATVRTGDAFVSQLNADGSALVYSSYFGGAGDDFGIRVALDAQKNVYVAGNTSSLDFPNTGSAVQRFYGGGSGATFPFGDGFLMRLADQAPAAANAPAVNAVVNGASFAGGSVSAGLIAVVFGARMSSDQLQVAAAGPSGFPRILAETRILFDDVAAPILYTSAGQCSVIVPYSAAGRPNVRVVIEYRGVRSAPLVIPVSAAVPALFTANSSGRGQAAALNQDSSFNGTDNQIDRGGVIVLFGTGEGQTNPPGVDGQLATATLPKPLQPVEVMIGGLRADVLYAGAAPGLVAGVMQINATVPLNAPSGNVPVVVKVGDAQSQPDVTIAVR